MRYCKVIKGYSIKVCKAQNMNNFSDLTDIQPYIEGIIWSTDKLNIKYLQDFNKLIFQNFGPETYAKLQQFNMVDFDLQNCFATVEPSPKEIKDYLDKFLDRYNLKMKDYSPMESYTQNNYDKQM